MRASNPPAVPTPLADLQARFAAALCAGDEVAPDPALLAAIRDAGIPPAARLAVYRRSVRGNFLKALALEFPTVGQLGGAAWFRQAGLAFQQAHPSASGDLHGIGAPFAAFLAQRLAATPHAYFADVAALEWAWQECLVAAEPATTLDVAALARITGTRATRLRLWPHPAMRLVESRWPVFEIWSWHRDDGPGGDAPAASGTADAGDGRAPLDLDAGGECVLLRRSGEGAEARCIAPANYAWLRALAADATLGDALEAALARDPGFDVARALATAVAQGLFCGYAD